MSEPIKGQPDYHIMVHAVCLATVAELNLSSFSCFTGTSTRPHGTITLLDLLGSGSVCRGYKGHDFRQMADMTAYND